MARGTQFGELITGLKEELNLSTNVGVGVDSRPMLMRAINRTYELLYRSYEWPHLRVVSDRITLSAGQRFYDFPDDLDYETVNAVHVWWNAKPLPVERGVGIEEYAAFDPEDDDQRSDPVLKWDTQWRSTDVQFEVWPVPSSNAQTIQFTGIKKFVRLVNDEDQAHIDDQVIILFAAARILKQRKSPDADTAQAQAVEALSDLRKLTGPSRSVRMGLGNTHQTLPTRTTVRISS